MVGGGAGEVNARMDCYNEGVDRWGNKSYKSITTPSKEKGQEKGGRG